MSVHDINDPRSKVITAGAIEQVEAAANDEWKEAAADALEQAAIHKQRISALDVWKTFRQLYGELADTGTHRLCAMGPVFRRAASAGIIKRTGDYVNGPSGGIGTDGHTKALPVWLSLVYDLDAPPITINVSPRCSRCGGLRNVQDGVCVICRIEAADE